jgi:hypothetical protein
MSDSLEHSCTSLDTLEYDNINFLVVTLLNFLLVKLSVDFQQAIAMNTRIT